MDLLGSWTFVNCDRSSAIINHCEDVLTKCRLIQEVQLCGEGLQLWVSLLDDVDDEVHQCLFSVCRFGVQQLGRASKE